MPAAKEIQIPIENDDHVQALSHLNISGKIGESFHLSEVKKNWRRLAVKLHPDKQGSEEKFKEALRNYEVLIQHASFYENREENANLSSSYHENLKNYHSVSGGIYQKFLDESHVFFRERLCECHNALSEYRSNRMIEDGELTQQKLSKIFHDKCNAAYGIYIAKREQAYKIFRSEKMDAAKRMLGPDFESELEQIDNKDKMEIERRREDKDDFRSYCEEILKSQDDEIDLFKRLDEKEKKYKERIQQLFNSLSVALPANDQNPSINAAPAEQNAGVSNTNNMPAQSSSSAVNFQSIHPPAAEDKAAAIAPKNQHRFSRFC